MRSDPRSAGDGDSLAPYGVRPVLEVEEPQAGRAPPYGCRDPHPHPSDGPRQRRLGRSAHPRGAAQARLRRQRGHGVARYASTFHTAIADMAHVPRQPHAPCRGDRLLRSAHGDLPLAVRVRRPGPRTTTHRALQRHRRPLRLCTDHVIVTGAAHLRRVLREYVAYYNADRTHLGLDKDAPAPRPVLPPGRGQVIALSRVGGLHHRYDRRAA